MISNKGVLVFLEIFVDRGDICLCLHTCLANPELSRIQKLAR